MSHNLHHHLDPPGVLVGFSEILFQKIKEKFQKHIVGGGLVPNRKQREVFKQNSINNTNEHVKLLLEENYVYSIVSVESSTKVSGAALCFFWTNK